MRRLDGIEVSRMRPCDCPTLDTENFCNIPREISLCIRAYGGNSYVAHYC